MLVVLLLLLFDYLFVFNFALHGLVSYIVCTFYCVSRYGIQCVLKGLDFQIERSAIRCDQDGASKRWLLLFDMSACMLVWSRDREIERLRCDRGAHDLKR